MIETSVGISGIYLKQPMPGVMKWTLIIFLGASLVEGAMGWRYYYSNQTMNWTKARQWCQTYYTDLVAIQSQEENDYLVSLLPDRSASPYYWIGITKVHETWTWVGNNSTWIGNQSWAENEPNNNYSTEYCVEIYVNRGREKNKGKWNDEKCNSQKYPACYQAQCNQTICNRGTCLETINNITCDCEPGFEGDRCQAAVKCGEPITPQNGIMRCSGPNGNHSFDSSCSFLCAEGYELSGPAEVRCNSSGLWHDKETLCKIVECAPLSQPENGFLDCSGGNQTFNTTCRFGCSSGFLLLGSPEITCRRVGVWSGPRPMCASYKHVLMAVAGCGAFSTICCICFCCIKHRRKKLAQPRQPEEVPTSPRETQEN